MLALKLTFQILLGVATLCAILIDYKYTDKRTRKFKILRRLVLILAIIIFIFNLGLTYYDDREKNAEALALKVTIDSVKFELKNESDSTRKLIKPFLDLATSSYPNLPTTDALNKLRFDVEDLKVSTIGLEDKTIQLLKDKKKAEKLRNTPPAIYAWLSMDSNLKFFVFIKFLNLVPINISYRLINYTDIQQYSNSGNYASDLYPKQINDTLYLSDDFNFRDNLRKTEISKIKLVLKYQSVYFKEKREPSLTGTLEKVFIYNPFTNSLTTEQ
jgi:hypothetical protein